MNHDGYRSRKFWLACASFAGATTALFTGYLDGAQWIAAITLVLGMYQSANVLEKRQ